ncbi:MAG: hypothetical protein QOD63_387, partial [Actinomycetota bacterium]|nr:hypothetical protein [Actinomycetota bacterium]
DATADATARVLTGVAGVPTHSR